MKDEYVTGVWVFFFWTLFLIFVTSVIGYNGLYGQDSYEYLRYCGRLFDFISNGAAPGDYFWPVNYPLMGALLSFVTGPQIALQLLSILSAAWILYLVIMFLIGEFPGREREVIVYVLLFLGLSPYFFRYSISSMSDLPALAFACTAYYGLYRGYRQHHSGWLYATWFFSAMAIFTRFAFLPLVAPAIIFSCYSIFKNFRLLPFICAVVTAVIPVAVYLFFKQNNSGHIFQHYLVTDWSFYNYFRNNFTTIDGNSQYSVPNIIFVFSFLLHPGFLFPGVLFLYLFIRKRTQPSLIYPLVISGVLFYLLFIAGIPSRNVRYLVPVLPFYLTVCFPGYLFVLSWFYKRKHIRTGIFAAAVFLQLIFTTNAFLPFLKFNRLEKYISEIIIDYHPAVLYTFGMDGALKSYGYRGTIINLWDEPLDSISKGALLLFNKQKNEKQWRGRNPMLNFELILDKAHAVKIEDLESGWELYEVKEAYPDTHTGISR